MKNKKIKNLRFAIENRCSNDFCFLYPEEHQHRKTLFFLCGFHKGKEKESDKLHKNLRFFICRSGSPSKKEATSIFCAENPKEFEEKTIRHRWHVFLTVIKILSKR